MQLIYDNMTKMFDAFTQGVLTGQGANSEMLLRSVYRSLNDDFLKIVQDSRAVDKIIEVIKNKQQDIEPEKVDTALVSETTKKVITKTLDPNDLDPMQVTLDFVDELQTAILQVKLNLSREYERGKLRLAKSIQGQQQDLDRLNGAFQDQDKQIVDTISQMSEDEEEWKDENLENLESLLETFNQFDEQAKSDNQLPDLLDTLDKDKSLKRASEFGKKKYNPKKLIDEIKGLKPIEVKVPVEEAPKEEQGKAQKKVESPKPPKPKETPKTPKVEKADKPKQEKPKVEPKKPEEKKAAAKPAEKPKQEKPKSEKKVEDKKKQPETEYKELEVDSQKKDEKKPEKKP